MIYKNRIKELRQKKGISLEQLSGMLNVSSKTVFLWENAKSDIKISYLIEIAKIFDTTIDYLLFISDRKNSAEDAEFNKIKDTLMKIKI